MLCLFSSPIGLLLGARGDFPWGAVGQSVGPMTFKEPAKIFCAQTIVCRCLLGTVRGNEPKPVAIPLNLLNRWAGLKQTACR